MDWRPPMPMLKSNRKARDAAMPSSAVPGIPSAVCLSGGLQVDLLNSGKGCPGSKSLLLPTYEMESLLQHCMQLFKQEPTVLELKALLRVGGDVQGNLGDLLSAFNDLGGVEEVPYLFLGDYVGHGIRGLEIMTLLLQLKKTHPDRIHLLCGNHETKVMLVQNGFETTVVQTYGIHMSLLFRKLFALLPLAAVIQGQIFCVHGGISADIESVTTIQHISRPVNLSDSSLVEALLWSDPHKGFGFGESTRGCGCIYGQDVLQRFLCISGCFLMMRSHGAESSFLWNSIQTLGYSINFDKQVVTIHSATEHHGAQINQAA